MRGKKGLGKLACMESRTRLKDSCDDAAPKAPNPFLSPPLSLSIYIYISYCIDPPTLFPFRLYSTKSLLFLLLCVDAHVHPEHAWYIERSGSSSSSSRAKRETWVPLRTWQPPPTKSEQRIPTLKGFIEAVRFVRSPSSSSLALNFSLSRT